MITYFSDAIDVVVLVASATALLYNSQTRMKQNNT